MSRRSSWRYSSPSTARTGARTAGTRASCAGKVCLARGVAARQYSVPTPRINVNTSARERPEPLRIAAPARADFEAILSSAALEFLAALNAQFGASVAELLQRRAARKLRIEAGERPDFLPETNALRASAWRIAAVPEDLLDRRVEITGPTDRKMIINALNSGARVFMADFEDSNSPTWQNLLDGQINLCDASTRTLDFKSAEGKSYQLMEKVAVLMVRP